MSDKSKIEWCDATWNVVTGCTKVSQGCKHCYAERQWARLSKNPQTVYYGRDFTDVQCHPERLDWPLRWKRPRRIFVNAMSDLFHEDVPFDFIHDIFSRMGFARHHTYQILTKRPERMKKYFDLFQIHDSVIGPWPWPHVWLGVSVENQETFEERHEILLKTPAAVRWISAEPLLGPIDIDFNAIDIGLEPDGFGNTSILGGLDWVVAGGESGDTKVRITELAWVRSLRDQCVAAGIPFNFKQWGRWLPGEAPGDLSAPGYVAPCFQWQNGTRGNIDKRHIYRNNVCYASVGKKAAGRLLDGRMWDEYPG